MHNPESLSLEHIFFEATQQFESGNRILFQWFQLDARAPSASVICQRTLLSRTGYSALEILILVNHLIWAVFDPLCAPSQIACLPSVITPLRKPCHSIPVLLPRRLLNPSVHCRIFCLALAVIVLSTDPRFCHGRECRDCGWWRHAEPRVLRLRFTVAGRCTLALWTRRNYC